MARLTLENVGRLLQQRRGDKGLRVAALEIGVSPATLSRVENGHVPDLDSLRKLCRWLGVDAGELLGTSSHKTDAPPTAQVSFRKDRTVSQESAAHLAQLILSAQRAVRAKQKLESA
jgi:transcriptional regulator with XRE-family HTH domain